MSVGYTPRRSLASLAAIVALLLAACSGDNGAPGAGGAEPAAPSEVPVGGEGDEVTALDPDEAEFGAPPADVDRPDEPTPEIEGESYRVRVEAPSELDAGERAEASIHVEPTEEWRMNHDFPMALEVDAPDGVHVVKERQELEDAVHYTDDRGEWSVTFTAEERFDEKFFADFQFAVCTDAICIPKREKLAWDVDVDWDTE